MIRISIEDAGECKEFWIDGISENVGFVFLAGQEGVEGMGFSGGRFYYVVKGENAPAFLRSLSRLVEKNEESYRRIVDELDPMIGGEPAVLHEGRLP